MLAVPRFVNEDRAGGDYVLASGAAAILGGAHSKPKLAARSFILLSARFFCSLVSSMVEGWSGGEIRSAMTPKAPVPLRRSIDIGI